MGIRHTHRSSLRSNGLRPPRPGPRPQLGIPISSSASNINLLPSCFRGRRNCKKLPRPFARATVGAEWLRRQHYRPEKDASEAQLACRGGLAVADSGQFHDRGAEGAGGEGRRRTGAAEAAASEGVSRAGRE